MKLPKLPPTFNDQFWKDLVAEVFGPCTVIGECCSGPELKADYDQSGLSFRQWFDIKLDLEEWDINPEYPGKELTDAQIKYLNKRCRDQLSGIRQRMKEYLAK